MTSQKAIGLIALIVIIAAAGYLFFASPEQGPVKGAERVASAEQAVQQEEPPGTVPETVIASEPAAGEESAAGTPAPAPEQAAGTAEEVTIDVEKALAPRTMGNPDAPVTIEEFASLSCSHCAHFGTQTFPQIKENYIDTGKVRFIYTDYPLNAPAMDGAMVARCLPEESYFKFIKFLFETQEDWAFAQGYRNKLIQNAKLLGATEPMLEACLESQELKQGLIERIQAASSAHNITSTPSFLINGTEMVRGAQSYEAMSQIIDQKLKESNATE